MAPDSDHETETGGLFDAPEGFYPPTPPPTQQTHTLASGETLTLHLVGYSPGEAHHLWNGSRVISGFFEANPVIVRGKTVLELGAGAALPSIVCAALGARRVVATDLNDPEVLANVQRNVDLADERLDAGGEVMRRVFPMGFPWGSDAKPLLELLFPREVKEGSLGIEDGGAIKEAIPMQEQSNTAGGQKEHAQKPGENGEDNRFDVLILADLLFRHSEHGRLLKTVAETLRRDGAAYVFFTSYRPWLQYKDLAFFDLARERGFVVEKVLEHKMDEPLFKDDPGDTDILRTVTGWTLRWPNNSKKE